MFDQDRIRFAFPQSGWLLVLALIACGIRDLGISAGIVGALMLLLSLAVHELGHVSAAAIFGVPVHEVGLKFIGAYTRRQRARRQPQEIAISAAGPFASVFLFFVLFFVPKIGPWLSAWNLGIAIFNLIPYAGTDGHRILKEVLCLIRPETSPLLVPIVNQHNAGH